MFWSNTWCADTSSIDLLLIYFWWGETCSSTTAQSISNDPLETWTQMWFQLPKITSLWVQASNTPITHWLHLTVRHVQVLSPCRQGAIHFRAFALVDKFFHITCAGGWWSGGLGFASGRMTRSRPRCQQDANVTIGTGIIISKMAWTWRICMATSRGKIVIMYDNPLGFGALYFHTNT